MNEYNDRDVSWNSKDDVKEIKEALDDQGERIKGNK